MPRDNVCGQFTGILASAPAKAAGLLLMLFSAQALAVANACQATFSRDNNGVGKANFVRQNGGCDSVTPAVITDPMSGALVNGFAIKQGSCTAHISPIERIPGGFHHQQSLECAQNNLHITNVGAIGADSREVTYIVANMDDTAAFSARASNSRGEAIQASMQERMSKHKNALLERQAKQQQVRIELR